MREEGLLSKILEVFERKVFTLLKVVVDGKAVYSPMLAYQKEYIEAYENQNLRPLKDGELFYFFDATGYIYCMRKICLGGEEIGHLIFCTFNIRGEHPEIIKPHFEKMSEDVNRLFTKSYELFMEIFDFLRKGLPKRYTNIELCEKFNLHKNKINELFKHHTGTNFYNHYQEMRVEWAKKELKLPNRTVSEVAEILEYADESSLRRAMRAVEKKKRKEILL